MVRLYISLGRSFLFSKKITRVWGVNAIALLLSPPIRTPLFCRFRPTKYNTAGCLYREEICEDEVEASDAPKSGLKWGQLFFEKHKKN